jgi:hypothetical protein
MTTNHVVYAHVRAILLLPVRNGSDESVGIHGPRADLPQGD